MRDKIDIKGTSVDVEIEHSKKRIESINLVFNMVQAYSKEERQKLEHAAGLCPIKSSFHPETAISVQYKYPERKIDPLPNIALHAS